MRPATRIGRIVIFEGGYCGTLKLLPYLLFVLGRKNTVNLARDLVDGAVLYR